MSYTKTLLWKKTLGKQDSENSSKIDYLKDSFENARKNSRYLLDKIRNDFPNLTQHDISHVDGLWQVGSVIIGQEYDVNPLEGYVLGCAFLIHDSVLSYEAAGGQAQLRKTVTWKDYYTDYCQDEDLTDEQKLYETDFKTIRFLHAKYAEKLYNKLFRREDGSQFYIIEDESLRNHLGEIICKIAASHHWDIEKVEKLGIQWPALPGYPVEWRLNPLKLACILRCADAGHIDSCRAPDYLLKLLDINGISRDHWISQNRLSQIDIDVKDKDKIIIKSNIKFGEKDFSAWNVAYDAVCVLNHELKISNEILKKNHVEEFQAKTVRGADSREALCKYIEPDGWMPCDVNLHISNIEGLIKNLGGEKLYGTGHKFEIALRELIQNSRDAIVARRKMESGFEGKISISIDIKDDKTWVSVADDGVGMSINTIKDYFLNFGSSFWASDLSKQEHPGLASSGFKSVGRFGIGFYAVFMVASEVIVETRRYDKALDETLFIKFPMGLTLRPIISHGKGSAMSVSTIVRFSVDTHRYQWKKVKTIEPHIHGESSFEVPYHAVISHLTACLDVDVLYSELGAKGQFVHTNIEKMKLSTPEVAKWLKDISFSEFHPKKLYSKYIDENYMRLRKIIYKGKLYGIAAINTFWGSDTSYFSITTIGGLSNCGHFSNRNDFIGCLIAEPLTAKRDGTLDAVYKSDWIKEQYDILYHQGFSKQDCLYLPYYLGAYDIDFTEEMEIRFLNHSRNIIQDSLKNILLNIKTEQISIVFPLSNFSEKKRIENYTDYDRSISLLKDNEMLFVTETNSDFLNIDKFDNYFPNTLIHCISTIAKKYSLEIKCCVENDKAVSRIMGRCRGYVISVS